MKLIVFISFLYIINIQNDIVNASYYGEKHHGKTTASGEIFDMNDMTAAHKTLEFGTIIKVTSIDTDKSVVVKINDRGPYIKGRSLDLSKASFFKIAPKKYGGSIKVKLEIIK